jgi:transcriptional regulator with XRE-family HTH domain
MLSSDRRSEIATFLRVRRTRLQPEDVGLTRGRRRRTPGLRREEVAALAGVSTEWYTWLEQAREVHPSAETLRRISAALGLEPGESQHLLTLAGYGLSENGNGAARPSGVSPGIQRLLDELGVCPAWVYGERYDVLAWNEAASVLHGGFDSMQGIERNGLYQLYLSPRMRQMLVDWELHGRDCVAKLRAAYARHVEDPWFNELITLLRARSPEFAEWWNDHEVQLFQDGRKAYDHPEVGRLTFDYTVFDVVDEGPASLHLITYLPAPGTDTREKMELLLSASPSRSGELAVLSP